MNILVTGGAGFVGSHLCEVLLKQGHTVTTIDDLSTGFAANISHLTTHPTYASRFKFVVASVVEKQVLEPLIQASDQVYHLAAAVGVKLIVNDPINTIFTNIRGTEAVLELSNRWRKSVLLTSTSEVYGKNPQPSFSESDDMVLGATTQARWAYACSKAIDEFLMLAYHRKNQLPCIVARLFNTVGPRQTSQYGMVIPTFVRQALRGRPITVYGEGQQSRTFCHVHDAVSALVALPTHTSAYGQVFNIGGTEEITMQALAERVKARTQSDSPIIKVPYESAYAPGFEDMSRRVPNTEKLRKLTGYSPQFGLNDIIDDVVAYFKAHPHFI